MAALNFLLLKMYSEKQTEIAGFQDALGQSTVVHYNEPVVSLPNN